MTFEEFYKDRIEGEPLGLTSIRDTWDYQQKIIDALEKKFKDYQCNHDKAQQYYREIKSHNEIMRETLEWIDTDLCRETLEKCK